MCLCILLGFVELLKEINLTYGEAWAEEKFSTDMINGEAVPLIQHKYKPKRMCREDAERYYTDKINKYFGIDKKEDCIYKGFDSIDDYYDYYEAQKLLEELQNDCV